MTGRSFAVEVPGGQEPAPAVQLAVRSEIGVVSKVARLPERMV